MTDDRWLAQTRRRPSISPHGTYSGTSTIRSNCGANPLVARFFEGPHGVRPKETATLAFIRGLVEQGAERHLRSASRGGYTAERARRQYEIVLRTCMRSELLEHVAGSLGISLRQCYRERSAVQRAIAEYIGSFIAPSEPAISTFLNEYRLRMDRAALRVELGEFEQAIRDYDDIAGAAVAPAHRIEAFCLCAEACLEAGSASACAKALTSAQQLLDDDAQLLTSAAATAARAHVGFVRSKLLAASGRLTDSWAALKDALGRVEGNVERYGDRLRTLATRLLLESCDQQLFLGEFGAANAQLTKAERIADGVRSLASTLRFDLMLDRWMLKWAEANADARSLRLRQYESLRKIAASSGSVASPKRSIHLARAFMLYYAESDEQEMALDWARRSLRMARVQPGRRAAASAALEVAEWLSTTAMWRRIPGLLGLAEGVFVEGTSDWAFLEGLWVVYFLEAGRYRDAWVRAKALERATEGTGNRRFQGAVQTKVAVAAHFLGKRDEAGDYIAAAVEMTERYGTPWTKRDADRAAAMIRG